MLKTYMIGYDLNSPGQGYDELIKAIKALGTWWHCLDSTWLIRSELTAAQIRDHLKQFTDSNDELLVARMSGEGAWIGFNTKCSEWLKNNL